MNKRITVDISFMDGQQHRLQRNVFSEKPYCLIGRKKTSDIIINDLKCSRCHAMLLLYENQCYLIAYGKNGTCYEKRSIEFSDDSLIMTVSEDNPQTIICSESAMEQYHQQGQQPVERLPGYQPEKYICIESISELIGMALSKNGKSRLASLGRLVHDGGTIGLGTPERIFKKLKVQVY